MAQAKRPYDSNGESQDSETKTLRSSMNSSTLIETCLEGTFGDIVDTDLSLVLDPEHDALQSPDQNKILRNENVHTGEISTPKHSFQKSQTQNDNMRELTESSFSLKNFISRSGHGDYEEASHHLTSVSDCCVMKRLCLEDVDDCENLESKRTLLSPDVKKSYLRTMSRIPETSNKTPLSQISCLASGDLRMSSKKGYFERVCTNLTLSILTT